MNRPIAAVSSLTDLNVPRRMACRVMMPMKISTRRLAVKVLRDSSPSPVVLADWIGDATVVIALVAVALLSIGQDQGCMHGAFEYAMGGICGLFVVGIPVYW
jgi:hypothetical protein